MTSSDLAKPAPVWSADPLLSTKAQAPGYLRTQWDEKSVHNFGPWRLSDRPDPAHNQTAVAHSVSEMLPEAETLPSGAPALEPPAPSADIVETVEARLSESALQALRDEAYQRGLSAGVAQAQAQLNDERQHERELLRHLTIELRSLSQDPQRYFEPLKRLSLHVAEQLVRGELQVSGHTVDRLIQQCLEQFDHPTDKAVVSLHPADLDRLKAMDASVTQGLELEADPHLNPGSVRVHVDDTVVQDLIEHRLEPLARRLLNQPEAWINRSALLSKEKIEVSEVNVPVRDWGRPLPDVEDTQAKPLAAEPAAAADPTPPAEDSDGL